MRLPLTLTPRPSRLLLAAVASGHLSAAVAIGVASIPTWVIGLCCLLIAVSLWRTLRNLWLDRPISMVLRNDGRMEIELASGQRHEASVGRDTVVLPWLMVLACECGDRRRLLTLPADSLDAEPKRLLRLWLRWRTEPEGLQSR
jgi:hypothetical protein